MIATCAHYNYEHECPSGYLWIRFSNPEICTDAIEFLDETHWLGRIVYASESEQDTSMHADGPRSFMKGKIRRYQDVWYLPPARLYRTRGFAQWGSM